MARVMVKGEEEEVSGSQLTKTRVVSLVAAGDLEKWRTFVQQHLEGGERDQIWAAITSSAICLLKEMVMSSVRYAPFAIEAGGVLLDAHNCNRAVRSSSVSVVQDAVAEWCLLVGDENRAQQVWRSMLPADDDVTSLAIVSKIFRSALRAHDYTLAELEYSRGISLYRVVSTDLTATEVTNDFLYALGAILMARHRFTDASLRFNDLYGRTRDVTHLQLAVVATIQSHTSPARTQRLRTYLADNNTRFLGDLREILARAAYPHVLRPHDLQCFLQLAGLSDDGVSAAKEAFAEHNLQVVSSMYCNATFQRLGVIIGVSPSDVERLIARMVSERRLNATLDQLEETVSFHHPDYTSASENGDAKMDIICKELSHAVDLIAGQYPELCQHYGLRWKGA